MRGAPGEVRVEDVQLEERLSCLCCFWLCCFLAFLFSLFALLFLLYLFALLCIYKKKEKKQNKQKGRGARARELTRAGLRGARARADARGPAKEKAADENTYAYKIITKLHKHVEKSNHTKNIDIISNQYTII